MATIEIRRTHQLGKEGARIAVEQVAAELATSLSARHRWEGDGLRFECTGASGEIRVAEQDVCVTVSLSWLLTPAKGKIAQEIGAYLDRYLAARG